jgi:catechol-2,3-dioxygenase
MKNDIPSVAIGHVFAKTHDVKKVTKFYTALGLRMVCEFERMSILELRGGTHILFFKQMKKPKTPPKANFDLMVDDLKAFHATLKKAKMRVGKIRNHEQSGHLLFETKDPDGRIITVYSSHTEGRPV